MPRKGENIYKRKDGRWEGRYVKSRNGGKTKYGYVYGKSYSEVKKTLTVKRAIHITTGDSPAKDITVEKSSVIWLDEIRSRIKESTWIKYRNTVHHYIIPRLGDEKLKDLDYGKVSSFCSELLNSGGSGDQGLSCKTVSDTLTLVKTILKFAARHKYRTDISALDVSVKLKSNQLRVFTIQEERQLISAVTENPTLTDTGIMICLFTGIRVGELCALTWGDISLSEKTIRIHRTMQRIQNPDGPTKTRILIAEPKSQCSIRTIPIPDTLINVLPEPAPDDAFILTGSSASFIEPRTMQNRFKKTLKDCKIEDANFHALRHTFATRCVEAGFDIKSLSEILGHANVNITLNRYVHPSMDLKQENMKKLDSLFAVR